MKRVRFHKEVTVHEVPREGRGKEPGYEARMDRAKGLRLHGIGLPHGSIDDDFGLVNRKADGSKSIVKGKRGTYTDLMARRNIWHYSKYGEPWYEAAKMFDDVLFMSRYGRDEHRAKVAEMTADFMTGRTKKRP